MSQQGWARESINREWEKRAPVSRPMASEPACERARSEVALSATGTVPRRLVVVTESLFVCKENRGGRSGELGDAAESLVG